MINGNLEQFLDTGWFSEATLYLNGYTYWLEGSFDRTVDKPFHFKVIKYRSIVVDNKYTRRLIENDDVVDYQEIFTIDCLDEAEAKKEFLSKKLFDGKTFWEVEKEIAWYDEY